MTLFPGRALLVSLPGAELATMDLPGSLVELHDVLVAGISPELRTALHLLRDHAPPFASAIKCVARPELFLCGPAQNWLAAQTEGIFHHVCLSDGSAIKILPPFETHVFFYRRAFPGDALALRRLLRRAPELACAVQSQVNSRFHLGSGASKRSLFIGRLSAADHGNATLLPFVLNRHSAADSANRVLQQKPIVVESLLGFASVHYVPLTQAALADEIFASWLRHVLIESMYTPAQLLLLRLPAVAEASDALTRQIAALLPALRRVSLRLPHIQPKNIVFLSEDITETHLLLKRLPFHITVHESFDYWRYTQDFYARAAAVTVVAPGGEAAGFLPADITGIYGPNAMRLMLETAA